MKKGLLTFLVLTFVLHGIIGQIQRRKIYHFSRNSGLSQSTVNCIIKDVEGFMWFGTRDGLNRFNGYDFTYYQHHAGDPNSIGLGRVNILFIDTKERLWAGTDQGGLSLYEPLKDNFTRYTKTRRGGPDDLSDVRAIHEHINGDLWIGSQTAGLWLFNPEKELFTAIGKNTIKDVEDLVLSESGTLFIGTSEGVRAIENVAGKAYDEMEPLRVEGLQNIQVISLHLDKPRQCLWVGTFGQGAFCYDLRTREILEFSTKMDPPYRLNHDIIRAFETDPQNNILIGTGGGGLHQYVPEEGKMTAMISELNNQYSLNSNIIYSLFRDDTDNIWIGTYNGGINVMFRYKDKFQHIKSYGGEHDLTNNAVLSITEDKDHKLWIGTDGGGLNYYDPETGIFKDFKAEDGKPDSPGGNVIKTIFIDSRGLVWLGTFNQGMTCYDPESKGFTSFVYDPKQNKGLSSNHVWDILEDDEGMIWIATLGGGLCRYNPGSQLFSYFRNDPQDPASLSNNTLSSLLIDRHGKLWVGTESGGICRLDDAEEGIFMTYSRTAEKPLINSNHITTVFEDSEGNLWAGTIGGGLNLYDPVSDCFNSYTEREGLASNLVYSILEDDDGNLWISTNNGISEFRDAVHLPGEPRFVNYNVGDGLQSNEFNAGSACKTHDGTLYFGGINGMNCFKPSGIVKNDHIPPIVFTDFKIFNKSIDIKDPNSPLKYPISQTTHITLTHKQSVFSFEFAALDYTNPSQNRYRFKLEGFEESWNEVGSQRMATYTNLDPGTYVFRVQGSNNDGIWNEEGRSITITILAPFWRTFWFRAAAILVIALIILGIFWWRIKDNELQRRKLKRLVGDRTRKLEELNHILEDQNKEIQSQQKELVRQKEFLEEKNRELADNQKKIQEQNKELENHKNNLQELVSQRTAELEMAKSRAEESDRLKTAFLANMSHEIRTPLNAIVGFSALLAEDDVNPEERDQFITQIKSNTDILLVLIADILDLSKIESDQIDLNYTETDLNAFFSELAESVKIDTDTIQYITENKLEEKNIKFITDTVRLRQILTNLLSNAIKFTDSGYIRFETRQEGKSLVFGVEDTGIGMPPEVIGRIFDRFYKFESPTSRLYRGTGLGLTITRNLITILGGEIRVESEIAKGSKFEVVFPLENEL